MSTLAELFESLTPDVARAAVPATEQIRLASAHLFAAKTGEEREKLLGTWIVQNQPCVFGRVAVRVEALRYCVLLESDLGQGDDHVRRLVQEARARWKLDAFAGEASAFVIAVLSPRVMEATPDNTLFRFAARVLELYLLLDQAEADRIYLDDVELSVASVAAPHRVLRFDVGVNFFSFAGDSRWWHDHRFPGGVAFSMNSVGHFVHAGKLRDLSADIAREVLGDSNDQTPSKLSTLDEALAWAMRTIASASTGPSGKNTCLVDAESAEVPKEPRCPVTLPASLAPYSSHAYRGLYHTDVTLPSGYFFETVVRPATESDHLLDFTYLWDDRLGNPANLRMARGLRVRGIGGATDDDATSSPPIEQSELPASDHLVSEACRKARRARGEMGESAQ